MANLDHTVLVHLTAALEKLDEMNENAGTTFEGKISVFDLNGTEKTFEIKANKGDGMHQVVF